MRILLRADAGVHTGTGHVMRCLTLAEELVARGHEVVLRGTLGGIDWLSTQISSAGIRHEPVELASLDVDLTSNEGWDAVVVDSYLIDATSISRLDKLTPILAIIDGDERGIVASGYLDQNLGAEALAYPAVVAKHLLAGSRYCLVRRAVRELRIDHPWRLRAEPTVLAFMGGSDPLGAIRHVAEALSGLPAHIRLTLVTPGIWKGEVNAVIGSRPGARLVNPSPKFPELLAGADIVVSATGTSAWDICTLGLPAVFAAVVDNQQAGLRAILDAGVGLGVDATENITRIRGVRPMVESLLADESVRREHVDRALAIFDGQGVGRVADALEELAAPRE